jgi:biopolymer transport protein ExbB
MKKVFLSGLIALSSIAFISPAFAQGATSLEELSQMVREETITDTQESRERIAAFQRQQQQQQSMLIAANAERDREERRSEELKAVYDENELVIADKQQQLTERLGTLRELFGHLTGFIGDVREGIDTSIVSAQYPGRTEFMEEMVAQMASQTELPSIENINRVWSETLDQIIEGGKVVEFTAAVGEDPAREVVRVGNYNLVSNGEYLTYDPTTGRISVLPSQPRAFQGAADDLQNSPEAVNNFGIDPTGPSGGSFLGALVGMPSWGERLSTQGGLVGYVLMGLLSVAILIAILKFIQLTLVSGKIRSQLKSDSANKNNPLGRILAVHEASPNVDTETLELKLNEAILRERPGIEAWLNALKIIAAVGPLLGLLGTVTGMILTFQGIALYGAGDVGGMAGGISQALITTVWGLIVAIPTILLHTLVNSQAMRIIHILDEQAAGIVAEKAEG